MPGIVPPGYGNPARKYVPPGQNTGRGGGGDFGPPRPAPTPKPKPAGDFSVQPQTVPTPKSTPKPAPRPPQLPPTPGKTTVPTRTVTPTPAPTPAPSPTPPKTPNLHGRNGIYYTSSGDVKLGKGQTLAFAKGKGYYAKTAAAPPRKGRRTVATPTVTQLTPEQTAAQAVEQALAPLYTAQGTQATQQNAAITSLTKAIIAQLQPAAGQIGGEYDQAIGQQTNLANSAADRLAAANPNTQDQALLSAINAPDAQRAALAAQNSAAFNGGAAVGSYVGGVLPVSSLQSQKLAGMGLAHQMPAIEGLRGQQALSAALASQSVDRAKIDAMRPDLLQKYQASEVAAQNAQVAQQQKQQYLDIARQSLGLKAQNQSFTQTLAVTKANQSIDKFNAQQTAKANKIDVQVSKSIPGGIARNSNGDPIIRGGKVMTINANGTTTAKVPTASQISGFVDKWKSGKTQSVTTVATDKDGNTVYDANGAPKTITETKTSVKPLNYQQAYRRLRTMGLADQKARSYLNTAYKRGEQGRGWLTNEQRAALQKAGRQTYVGYFQGHAFIGMAQAAALKKANKLPPGELVNGRYFIAPGY